MTLVDRIRKWFSKKPEDNFEPIEEEKNQQQEIAEEEEKPEMPIETKEPEAQITPPKPEPEPPIEDESFGKIEGSEDGYGWNGNVMLGPDREMEMTIWPDDGYSLEDYKKSARSLFLLMKDSEQSILDQIAEKMLDQANQWEEDAALNDEVEFVPLNKEAFIKRIALESIIAHADGSATLYYNDGDIFWGHIIDVSIDAQGVVTSANIAG